MENALANGVWKPALKTLIAAVTGQIIGLNIVAPDQFSIATLGGWKRLGAVMLIAGIIAEARYWQDWASK